MINVISCVIYLHDLRLVALSAVICVLGCFTTSTLLARARAVSHYTSYRWLAFAAAVFGSSVWSLHFVAMLAFMPGHETAFDINLTGLSMVVSSMGVLLAFPVVWSRYPGWLRVSVSGVLLGLSVTGMHYVGVAAMTSVGFMVFDPVYVTASIVVSIVFSMIACLRADELITARRRLEVAGWMSLAICGLHFTGMTAISIVPGNVGTAGGTVLGTATLAIAVGAVSVAILVASLTATIIDQHLSQRALQDLSRMRLLSNLAQEVLIIYRDGVVLEINSAGERLFKANASQIVGGSLLDLFAKDSISALLRRERCPPNERRAEELNFQAVDGTLVAVELSCQAIDYMGKAATVVALRDLTDRKRDEARIRHLARHDTLTNLPNRYNLLERLEISLDAAQQQMSRVAVVYIDLDRFKQVNDLHGHAAGDALLIQSGKRILGEMEPTDMLARIGGDEFVMVLTSDANPEKVSILAKRVVETLRKPFRIEGHRIEIGASIGVALFPDDGNNVDALMRAADAAMYRVKQQGRGAVCFYEASMNAKVQARLQLEQELVGAIERGEFVLHYQPIVNGTTGEIETFEALIRWEHPTRGMVPPMEFIPLAEETGLVDQIGRWVIDRACREASRWSNQCRVAVNVSPVQFRHGHVCDVIRSALLKYDFSPTRLVIEVTEGILIDNTEAAVATLNELKEMGVRIALDDFGTGYSSLSYLQLFKFDKLKIDKSFIKRLGQTDDAMTLTRTIVNLGHNLGLQVTAEGVETEAQLAILQNLGCDHIQGYLVARPAPIGVFGDGRNHTTSLFEKRLDDVLV